MMSSNLPKRPLHSQQGATPIQLLHKLAPPHAIIHIGAGTGMGEMHHWQQWGIPHALIVDADPSRLDWAEQRSADQPGWHIQSAVLSETAGEIDYHQASNPEEDGILPPEQLATLWPNLRTTEKGVRQGQRLDQLLAKAGNAAFLDTTLTWLIVDCLPALPILKGAAEVLEHCSVLWLRVLLQPISAADNNSALLDNIAAYLQPKGFKCVDVSPGNHPALGYAIFVKDWQAVLTPQLESLSKRIAFFAQANDQQSKLADERLAQIQQLAAERDTQAQTAAERQSRIDTLTHERNQHAEQSSARQAQIEQLTDSNAALSSEKDALRNDKIALEARRSALETELAALAQSRDAQTQLATERQAQIQQLVAERDTQEQTATERQAQIQQLAAERDSQAQTATERQSRIDALTHERDQHAEQSSARQTQIEQLTHSHATLSNEKSSLEAQRSALETELAALAQARDAQTQLATQRKTEADQLQARLQQKEARIAQLESELAERDTRQQLLNDEMIRAEAQIDLIKDVLLREPGL